MSFVDLLDMLREDLFRQTHNKVIFHIWKWGGNFKIPWFTLKRPENTTIHNIRKKLIRESVDNQFVLFIERAERLDPGVREQVADMLNDLKDNDDYLTSSGWGPKILCTSIRPLLSSEDLVQEERFCNSEVEEFTSDEIEKQIQSGLKLLNVDIDKSAILVAVIITRGSPLACSNLMSAILISLGIKSNRDGLEKSCKISESIVSNTSYSKFVLDKVKLANFWRDALQGENRVILEAMIKVGHEGGIEDIKENITTLKKGADINEQISSFLQNATKFDNSPYPEMIFKARKYNFRKPFLYEKLSKIIEDD